MKARLFLRLGAKIPEALRPTARAALLLLAVFSVGTIGFAIIGASQHSLLDALYMTTITLTTVGFGEVIEVNHHPGAEIFTIALLVFGTGTFVYFFSNLTAFLVEGTVQHLFWRRRMIREINKLGDHYVVCGGGHTGEHVLSELIATERPFVLVEPNEKRVLDLHARFACQFPAVLGDATEDEVLLAAGLPRALGLVTCIPSDKDNILVTFAARAMNPALRIVARCQEPGTEAKLTRAGANAIVSPDRIGGMRLVSEMMRPTVVSFLDAMLRDTNKRFRVEEVTVAAGSTLDQTTVGSVRARRLRDFILLAWRAADGSWLYNPDDEVVLRPDSAIVFLGSPEARTTLEHAARPPARQPQGGQV